MRGLPSTPFSSFWPPRFHISKLYPLLSPHNWLKCVFSIDVKEFSRRITKMPYFAAESELKVCVERKKTCNTSVRSSGRHGKCQKSRKRTELNKTIETHLEWQRKSVSQTTTAKLASHCCSLCFIHVENFISNKSKKKQKQHQQHYMQPRTNPPGWQKQKKMCAENKLL